MPTSATAFLEERTARFSPIARGVSYGRCTEEVVGRAWRETQEELVRMGFRIPLWNSLAWAKFGAQSRRGRNRLLTVRDGAGRAMGSVAIATYSSRVLPGHRSLRVERLDGEWPEASLEAMVRELGRIAREDPKALRMSVRVFSRGDRQRAAEVLERHGFQRSAQPESYSHTLTLDLQRDEQAIFAGLHKTARKNLRQVVGCGLFARPLTDVQYAERIGALEDESMARSGGARRKVDWGSVLELSRRYPELSRISGLFLAKNELRPEALVAFAWGTMQGDHASYTAAGTTRLPHLKISLSYPLVWDLVLWAKREGASWFDLGGVTVGDSAADRLKGISDFKRYFSRTVEEVSEEWVLEPHPAKTRLARAASRGAHAFAGLVERFSGEEQTGPRVADGLTGGRA